MNALTRTIVVVALAAPPCAAQDTQPSPADEYKTLLAELHADNGGFRGAKTGDERPASIERSDRFALELAEFAERHPTDPLALDALLEAVRAENGVVSLTQVTWEMNSSNLAEGPQHEAGARAAAVLQRYWLKSDQLGPVCQRMAYGIRPEFEAVLRAVVQSNPGREIQGIACLALAQMTNARLLKFDLAKDRPELADRYERLLGKPTFDALRRDRAGAGREVEALFEKAAASYGDVKHPYGGTI